ncbi:MAG: hypothetical protein EOO24_29280 [Comamonadaceae bacterium]|nr:MAG: hypothetical protein EOO24_29280 [Comamonadaceae bacterium]
MTGYRTYNRTDQPVWVTIYTVGRVFKEDWGNVDPGTVRDWSSGHYAMGSQYQVRGQWPTTDTRFDTDTTTYCGMPRQLVLLGGAQGVYWSDPVIRTRNDLGVPAWITIYTEPGEMKKDWGDVEPGTARDWTGGGDYGAGSLITLLAEWDDAAPALQRDGQHETPRANESSSTKVNFIIDEASMGICSWRLASEGGEVRWVRI